MPKRIEKCRVCGSNELELVFDLGNQCLTGVFPTTPSEDITKGPIELVRCCSDNGCGLVQLRDSYDVDEMYGNNFTKATPSAQCHGQVSGKNTRSFSVDCARNTPAMVSAFNQNPYTQSLNSWA